MHRDMKRMVKRGKDMRKLLEVIDLLSTGNPLPVQYRDHALTGNRKGYRDCHIESDWLLIYKVVDDALIILATETGTHSDLFG
jgi:mRNA interferase YafQ